MIYVKRKLRKIHSQVEISLSNNERRLVGEDPEVRI